MDLRVLRYFLTVAKEQSFTKAAEQLNITQPTLSRQLAALEDELGVKLFDRGGHCSTLTNEGILLKRRALEVVDLEDKIISEFKGQNGKVEGRITIGCGEFMAIEMKPGDCINIPAEVKHWHGAAPDSWFSHLAVEVPGVDTLNEWCEAVTDEEYNKLK